MGNIGWRDVILVIAAAIGVYLTLSVVRIFRIGGNRRSKETQLEARKIFSGWKPYSPSQLPKSDDVTVTPELKFPSDSMLTNVECELDRLHRDNDHLREEMVRMHQAVSQLKAAHDASSPLNIAIAMARQGAPANEIASHSGIAVGEADMIVALVRREPRRETEQTTPHPAFLDGDGQGNR